MGGGFENGRLGAYVLYGWPLGRNSNDELLDHKSTRSFQKVEGLLSPS